jgi:hypothetical protein
MKIRKIAATIAVLHYLLNLIRAISLLPYEIKSFGKSKVERYEIIESRLENHFIELLTELSNFLSPLGFLAVIIFLGTFIFEKSNRQNSISKDMQIIQEPSTTNPNDQPSAGINVISFLIPLVGLIIYLTERDRFPRKAISAGKAAIWGVSTAILLSIISLVITFVFINSIGY